MKLSTNLLQVLGLSGILFLASCGGGGETKEEDNAAAPEATEDYALEIEDEEVSEPEETNDILSFENAKIVFEYGGKWSGTKTIYIDEYGQKVLTIDERMSGSMNLGQTISFVDGQLTKWSHMEGNTKASRENKSDADLKYLLKFAMLHDQLLQYKSQDQLSRGIYEYQGENEIAGKTCESYKSEAASTEVWRWNEIELFIDNAAMKSQAHTITAVSFEEGVEFPLDQCTPPENFEIEER